jgi:hypothetical protein
LELVAQEVMLLLLRIKLEFQDQFQLFQLFLPLVVEEVVKLIEMKMDYQVVQVVEQELVLV